MPIPVILELLAKQDPSVKKTLDDIVAQTKATLAAAPKLDLLPPNTLERTKLASQLLAQMRAESARVAGELVNVRDNLNEVGKLPSLSQQASAFNDIRGRLQEVGKASEDVRRVNPALEATYKTLTKSAEEGLKKVAERSRDLAEIGKLVTGAFAGTATVFGGVAVGALQVAQSYQSLQAKLVSVTGSVETAAEKFAFAQKFATETPFDVEGIVAATATIEGFKLRSEELLPVAAKLAAAMGTDLQSATLALSKAASGSADGFQVLKDTYAITNRELAANGAVVNKVSGDLSHLEKDTIKNKDALIRLVSTKFGDSLSRQAGTLTAAISNTEDSIKNLSASVGQSLIPAATGAARFLTGMFEAANNLPGPFKAIAAVSAVVVGGVAGLCAAAAASVTGLLLLQAQLAGMAATSPIAAAGLNLVTGSLVRVETAALGARTALLALAANPYALAFLAIAGTVGAATLAIQSWENEQVKAGAAVAQSSRQFAKANVDLRAGIQLINDAAGKTGKAVSIVANSADQIAQLQTAFKTLDPLQFAQAMDRAGTSVESFKTGLANAEGKITNQKELIAALKAELENISRVQPGIQAKTGIPPDNIRRIAEITEQIRLLTFGLGRTEASRAFFQGAIDKANELSGRLQPLIDESKTLANVLELGKSIGTARTLATALGEVEAQINRNAAAAEVASTDLDVLFQKLQALGQGPGTEVARNLLLEQIKLIQQRGSIVEAQGKIEADAQKTILQANEAAFARKKALQGQSLQEELAFIKSQLAIVKQGSAEETSFLEKEAGLKKQIRDKQAADAQKSFQDELKAATNGVREAQGGDNTNAVVSALEAAKTRVDAWANANKDLLRTYPAIQAELAKFRADNGVQLKAAETAVLRANYERLGQDIQTSLANATNSTQKLESVEKSLLATQKAKQLGLISETQAQTQLNQLGKQKLDLEKSISAERAQQAQTIANQELANAEQELQILQARKANGERVDNEILARQKAIFQQKLALIEQERVAAVEAANGEASAIEAINKTAQLKKDGLIKQETLAREQALDAQTAATDKALGDQEKRFQQFQNRVGGVNSPLQSFEEAFGGPGSFGLGNFSLDSPLKKAAAQTLQGPNSLRRVQAQVQAEANGPNATALDITKRVNEGQRAQKKFAQDALAQANGFPAGGQGAGGGTIQNIKNEFNGKEFDSPEFERACEAVFIKKLSAVRLRRS